jgi:hypothetical protein
MLGLRQLDRRYNARREQNPSGSQYSPVWIVLILRFQITNGLRRRGRMCAPLDQEVDCAVASELVSTLATAYGE